MSKSGPLVASVVVALAGLVWLGLARPWDATADPSAVNASALPSADLSQPQVAIFASG